MISARRGERRMLPARLAEAARCFSEREGVTLFMALMAAFKALLNRYPGQTDIPVATMSPTESSRDRRAYRPSGQHRHFPHQSRGRAQS